MDILFYTIPIALVLALIFLGFFIASVKSGQFEDLDTPSYRILIEDKNLSLKGSEDERSEK